MSRRVVAALAVAVVLLLFAVVVPFLGTDTEWALERCGAGAPSSSDADVVGWSWWPYGTRCRLTTSDGGALEQVVPAWRGEAQWKDR